MRVWHVNNSKKLHQGWQGWMMVAAIWLASLACFSTANATSVLQLSQEQMVEMSNLIVRGKVLKQKSIWGPKKMGIVTLVTIQVLEEMVGRTAPKEVIVRHFGGQIGNEKVHIAGFPTFTNGNEVVVFLQSSKYLPKEEYLLIGLSQGKYVVQRPEANTDTKTTPNVSTVKPEARVFRSIEGMKLFKRTGNQPLQAVPHKHGESHKTTLTLKAFKLSLKQNWTTIQNRRKSNTIKLPKPVLPKVKVPMVKPKVIQRVVPVKPAPKK
ncbi:MAG: hypothetical protein EP343_04870 [Deltaproteobacteria bacterium]|nr:MAG: hypothetical protein EP343_04870 [Deltaproteobacteria bacterium]